MARGSSARTTARCPNDIEKAKALIKEYGKPVEFKMLVHCDAARRASGQVLQQFWKQVGAEMEIEQVDQATIPPRAFQRKFDITPWRIVDFPDPDVQMFANFYSKSPVDLANYSNPELDKVLEHARVTPDEAKRTEDYCAISRLINKEATWFWTFQNTYYAIQGQGEGRAEALWRRHRRIQCLAGIACACSGFVARRLLYLLPVLVAVIAADIPDRLAAAGRSRLCDPGRPGDAGEGRGAAR